MVTSRVPAGTSADPSLRTLIDELLTEQQQLTAVERFSRKHEDGALPAQARYYQDLIPLTKPQRGEQYAFAVDLDSCTGCKACVSACHSLNGLDDDETWRGVGLLISAGDDVRNLTSKSKTNQSLLTSSPTSIQQHVTSACHHCVEPACAEGCPVLAYDKDPLTGIVRHLDDQCIGCQYCVMKCPYDVPKFSPKKGIVRKCDMCTSRLAVGEAPACVQACPHEAIKITVVKQFDIRTQFRVNGSSTATTNGNGNSFLPSSPAPRITLPTTRYISKHPLPKNLFAADQNALRLDHPHWPLVVMLVLTQAAAGMFVAATIAGATGFTPLLQLLNLIAFSILNLGLMAAPLHLGKPLKAWRAFLGWRKSWLSREIIAFNQFAPLAAAATALAWLPFLAGKFPKLGELLQKLPAWVPPLEKFVLPLTLGAVLRYSGRGTEDYRVGNETQLSLDSGYPLFQSVRLIGQLSATFHGRDDPGTSGAAPHHSGGQSVLATPGLRVQWTPQLASYAYFQYRVYEHSNGAQVVAPLQLMVGTACALGW